MNVMREVTETLMWPHLVRNILLKLPGWQHAHGYMHNFFCITNIRKTFPAFFKEL